jgi:hypothetical protein
MAGCPCHDYPERPGEPPFEPDYGVDSPDQWEPRCIITVDFPETEEGQGYCRRCTASPRGFHLFRYSIPERLNLALDEERQVLKLQCPRCGATEARRG